MPNKFALVVTISEYADPKNNLDGVKNDLGAILKLFADNDIYNIETLRDKNATLSNMQRGLEQLVRSRAAGDVCLFYFSGHGIQLPKEYSQTQDPDGRDEAMVTYDCSLSTLLLDNWMAQFLKTTLPSEVDFWGFYDCCHSGQLYKAATVPGLNVYEQAKELTIDRIVLDKLPTELGKSSDRELKDLTLIEDDSIGHSFHFGAAQRDRQALCKEIMGVRRSVFTWAMCEVIKHNTLLTVDEAEKALVAKVAEQTSLHVPQVACSPADRKRTLLT